jgi:dTDP-4-dehydrorhamnose 3,5-epimerase
MQQAEIWLPLVEIRLQNFNKHINRLTDMRIEMLPLSGLMLAHSVAHTDSRGAFMRLFCEASLSQVLGGRRIVQINHSQTVQVGAVRGMHYQKAPHAEMKLIRCLQGSVYDVAVDVRPESKTYLQHNAVKLNANDGQLFVIPEGFAHGFQVLALLTCLRVKAGCCTMTLHLLSDGRSLLRICLPRTSRMPGCQ